MFRALSIIADANAGESKCWAEFPPRLTIPHDNANVVILERQREIVTHGRVPHDDQMSFSNIPERRPLGYIRRAFRSPLVRFSVRAATGQREIQKRSRYPSLAVLRLFTLQTLTDVNKQQHIYKPVSREMKGTQGKHG
jgi:hypothetical protein